ncbi:MAG: hypothetical protein J07HN4v3_01065 [Halonotius sp. J07HN4]|nr:MAG: hypothetical protein J07HN4v3_01065 [Halonotius sp. J07HN4]
MPDECPRCDAPLERLQLGDSETITCTSCGYASIDADHSSEPAVVTCDCPRCGAPLDQFELGDSETVSCSACGYAGIDADHSGEQSAAESWDDAIQRFNTEH